MVEKHPKDRRVSATLRCEWRGCKWWFQSADAAAMDLAWLNHSRTAHWGMPPYERTPVAEQLGQEGVRSDGT